MGAGLQLLARRMEPAVSQRTWTSCVMLIAATVQQRTAALAGPLAVQKPVVRGRVFRSVPGM